VVVIGAGAIGASAARHLAQQGVSVVVLEKEAGAARHQSGRNSGVIHAGYNLKPGSLKAKYCVEGSRALRAFCVERGIPMVQGGILIVARTDAERATLAELHGRAQGNGVQTRLVDEREIRKIEPHAVGIAGLHAPEGASFDSSRYVEVLLDDARAAKADVRFGLTVRGISETSSVARVETSDGVWEAGVVLNCAGLYADRLAGSLAADLRIIPFRGYYAELVPGRTDLIRSHVYAAPDLRFPFLGVHLSRRVDGRVIVGPGAMLAFGREAYHFAQIQPRDLAGTLAWPGFWRMMLQPRFRALVRSEVMKSLFLKRIWAEASLLMPELGTGDLVRSFAGNRAQVVDRAGELVDDIVVRESGRTVHVLNAVSPGLTCSLPFGEFIAKSCLTRSTRATRLQESTLSLQATDDPTPHCDAIAGASGKSVHECAGGPARGQLSVPNRQDARALADFASGLGRPARLQFIANIVGAALRFLFHLLVARLFGAAVLGLFSLTTSGAQGAGMLSHLGGDYLILRKGYRSSGELTPESAFRIAVIPAAFASLAATMILVWLASFTSLLGTDPRLSAAMSFVAPTVIAFAWSTLIAAFLQATRQFTTYTMVQTLLEPTSRVVILLGLLLLVRPWQLPFVTFSISLLLTLAAGVFIVRSRIKELSSQRDLREAIRALRYSVPVMLSFALDFGTLFVSLVILNRFASAGDAGIYSAAQRLAMLTVWAQIAFTAPFLPMVASALEKDPGVLSPMYQRMVRFVMLINIPLLVFLFVGRHEVLGMFGADFVAGSDALSWLLVGQLVNTGTAAIEALLPLGGRTRLGLANSVGQLLAIGILSTITVPLLGVTGAGLSTGIAVVGTNSVRSYQVWKRWRVTPISGHLLLMATAGASAALVLDRLLRSMALTGRPLASLLAAGVGAVLVFIACVVLVTREDRTVLFALLAEPLRRRKGE
jgi:L-2-hydroxyglutarate oxidase